MRNLTIALGLLIFGLVGFYGGAKFENGKLAATPAGAVGNATGAGATGATGNGATGTGRGAAGGGGAAGAGGGGAFARGTFGQVTAVSGDTLTIQDAQGNQVKVQLQPNTTVVKTVSGSRTDLASGVTVTVAGQRGADGTVTATTVTIVPANALPGAAPSPRG